MAAKGGSIRSGVASGSPVANIRITVRGADRASDGFKQVRRRANTALRDAQQQVGERQVLPLVRARFASRLSSRWASTLYVKRDRLNVYLGSRLRGGENRGLGWLDFGGRRPRDHAARNGPHIITGTLHDKQPAIRASITDAILEQFARSGFDID